MSDIVERLRQHIGLDQLDEGDMVALVPRWEVEEAAAEIERLREENDALKVRIGTYYAGNANGGIVKQLEAEIERLRCELDEANQVGGKFMDEIERLRGLVRDGLRIDAGDFSVSVDDWIKRVREALGE